MKHISDWLLRDSHGHIVIVQRPNAPLIGWFVAAIASHALTTPQPHRLAIFVSRAFLFMWAYLEITKGSPGVRRILGGLVLLYLLLSVWS